MGGTAVAGPRAATQGLGLGTGSIPARGQLVLRLCRAPRGQEERRASPGAGAQGGELSCGGPACLRPVIKEEEEGEDAPGTGPEHRGQPDTGSA